MLRGAYTVRVAARRNIIETSPGGVVVGHRSWGFVERAAPFWNLDPVALAEHSEDVAELIERAQSAVAIAVATEQHNAGIYAIKPLLATLLGRPELARAWVTADKDALKCVLVELSVDGGRTFHDAMTFVPEEFRV